MYFKLANHELYIPLSVFGTKLNLALIKLKRVGRYYFICYILSSMLMNWLKNVSE